jgi:putative transposase
VGWSLSKGMKAIETTIPALRMALINRTPEKDLIFHSDRGVQYCCAAFRNVLAAGKITRQSMSRKGNCWDNAVAESFFKSLKVEWVYHRDYKTIEQAELSIFEWIETWYNKNRRHSFINNKTIDEFHLLNNFKQLAA